MTKEPFFAKFHRYNIFTSKYIKKYKIKIALKNDQDSFLDEIVNQILDIKFEHTIPHSKI
jgi:hypothetical protein